MLTQFFSFALLLLATGVTCAAAAIPLTVQTDQPGAKLNRAMWGIFFEDINFGADGGLYAELVKNRSFEFPDALMGWSKLSPSKSRGSLTIRDDAPLNAKNPHYLRLESQGKGFFGVANEGFRGLGVTAGEAYNFSAQIRNANGHAKLRVELYGANGALLDSARLEKFPTNWTEVTAVLHPKTTDAKAKLYVLVDGAGALDLDMVSLFPAKTWMNRPRGLRADMVQQLADLKPGFMRFPGGCIVEGSELKGRYQWKKTIGPVAERELLVNRWNNEFLHRPTPDYFQSFGLGFFEFFQLCEDIGAQPLPILSCGLACQFNSGEACAMSDLDGYIQDALDLIEFANSATNTTWGAQRAAMGHPAPFHLTMLGVGNENWDAPYLERYAKFHAILKAQHPEIQLVSSAGPSPDDAHFKYAWPKLRELHADIVDEHCYAKPDWFFDNTHRFDSYDRHGPKVFFGEYAAQSDAICSVENRNNLACAIAEAAYMTGLERNGEVVRMASYAPLFAHIEAWQWTPNLIWTDNLRSYGTPNYFVQKLFANYPGDVVLPAQLDLPATNAPRVFASATRDDATGEVILKLVNGTAEARELKINLAGAGKISSSAKVSVLAGESLTAENSFAQPRAVAPVETELQIASPQFPRTLPANSLTVLRVKLLK
ncbi:MAG: hypothetical protein RLZZ350_2585 [Verrucomicrobiota bacterium]